jgi:hypothetical protein
MSREANRAWALWFVGLLLPGGVAHAAGPDIAAQAAEADQGVARQTFIIDRIRAALADGDPRRAMIAAELAGPRHNVAQLQMRGDLEAAARQAEFDQLVSQSLALARSAGADDPLVQVLLALVCGRPWVDCDADAALTRLADLDPGNGLAALLRMDSARQRHQAEREREAFETFARAERLTTLEEETLVAVRDFIGNADLPAAMLAGAPEGLTAGDRRAMLVIGSWLALQRPGLSTSAISARCRAEPLGAADRDTCIAAARVLIGAGDAISPRIGLRLLEDLVDDPVEQARVRSRQRDLDWQTSAFAELTREVGATPGSVESYLDAMIAAGGERALTVKRLVEAGLPLGAPADYEPANPRLRD